jgi:hypothetical protein
MPRFRGVAHDGTQQIPDALPDGHGKAARIIRDGLARNRGRIAFPWPMVAIMRLLGLLPYPLLDWLLRRAPGKD